MFKNAPAPLVLLLAAIVAARVGIVFVVHSSLASGLLWAALLAGLSLGALYGKNGVAKALAYLCIVLGADALLQLLYVEVSVVHLAAAVSWAALSLCVGVYILRSSAVRSFYASAN